MYTNTAQGVTGQLRLLCPEFAILLYLRFCPQWEHISDFIADVSKKMGLVIQKHNPDELSYDCPGQPGLMAPQQRVVKSKRKNAGQLSKEVAAGMVPPKGRLPGHLCPPSSGFLSHVISPPLTLRWVGWRSTLPRTPAGPGQSSEWTQVRKQTSLNLTCQMPITMTQTPGKSR